MTFPSPLRRAVPTLAALASFAGLCLLGFPILDRVNVLADEEVSTCFYASFDKNVLGDEAGMHLVATLSKGPRDRDVSTRAAGQGLWAMPLSSCYLGKASRQGFVLGFGGAGAQEIREGVRRLRGMLFV